MQLQGLLKFLDRGNVSYGVQILISLQATATPAFVFFCFFLFFLFVFIN